MTKTQYIKISMYTSIVVYTTTVLECRIETSPTNPIFAAYTTLYFDTSQK